MQNIDRALAYAKQRGVEIPDRAGLEKMRVDSLKYVAAEMGFKFPAKVTKPQLVDMVMIGEIRPHLTSAQRRRIRHCNDHAATLAARKERKMADRVRRLARRMR